ncbi:MAG: hypothetical protein H6553_13245 [Chitinophagales bacterium]|nr:hypothetical protein [Chitinophagales bacterium]
MKTLQIKVSESDIKRYKLNNNEIKFTDLVESINKEFARKALLESNKIAKENGLSTLTLEEINAEINAVRNAKNNS